jgi:hypothetical protein
MFYAFGTMNWRRAAAQIPKNDTTKPLSVTERGFVDAETKSCGLAARD